MTAREVALRTLTACETQDAWADGFLKRTLGQENLSARDAALATRITFGVLQNRRLLDWNLTQLSKFPLDKLECAVRNGLRLGAYQMLFLDKVPVSAAVNESVKLVRKFARNPRAAGLVNGVLRNLDRRRSELKPPPSAAVRYSHPDWLAEEFTRRLGGEGAERLMEADNEVPPSCAQVNTCRFTAGEVLESLRAAGVEAEPHPWLDGCLLLRGTGNLEHLEAFQAGAFLIQDAAAKLAVLAAGPDPGMQVLDACAAPGGKSFAAAIAMGDRGSVFSCDLHPHKEKLIQAGARRLGLNTIQTAVMDAKTRREELVDRFDLVIADVPCSGLGIIRKKPDIRWKDPVPLAGLPAVQRAILENVSAYVKPGGALLYATCTLLERENEAVVRDFLDRNSDFIPEEFQLPGPIGSVGSGMLTLWPHLHGTDGFFMAKLRKRL